MNKSVRKEICILYIIANYSILYNILYIIHTDDTDVTRRNDDNNLGNVMTT